MKLFRVLAASLSMAALFAGTELASGKSAYAAVLPTSDNNKQEKVMTVDDFQIVRNEKIGAIRYVTAVPSERVCSNKIEIEVEGKTVRKVVFTRGCNGNGKGIGALIQGMSVEEAIKRLKGINCGNRGTSCPDQLARILEATCLYE